MSDVNRHPLIPFSTLLAVDQLVLHGLSIDGLHDLLYVLKTKAEVGAPTPVPPFHDRAHRV